MVSGGCRTLDPAPKLSAPGTDGMTGGGEGAAGAGSGLHGAGAAGWASAAPVTPQGAGVLSSVVAAVLVWLDAAPPAAPVSEPDRDCLPKAQGASALPALPMAVTADVDGCALAKTGTTCVPDPCAGARGLRPRAASNSALASGAPPVLGPPNGMAGAVTVAEPPVLYALLPN